MATPVVPLTHRLGPNQHIARRMARTTQDSENSGGNTLEVADTGPEAQYVIYIYNILNIPHTRHMPPNFPTFEIPACEPGSKFAYTLVPAYVLNRFNKYGTFEYYTQREDGRKSASQLLNPGSFPNTQWESQLSSVTQSVDGVQDQYGNNLNVYGCFWSLTRPDETEKLDKEIKVFEERARKTMNELVSHAEALHASGKRNDISPRMHFAMDYLKLQAPWHMSHQHMISCPNCGESIVSGLAYHRNTFNERCIIDEARCRKLGILPPADLTEPMPTPEATGGNPENVAEITEMSLSDADQPNDDQILAMAEKIREERRIKAAADRKAAKEQRAAQKQA